VAEARTAELVYSDYLKARQSLILEAPNNAQNMSFRTRSQFERGEESAFLFDCPVKQIPNPQNARVRDDNWLGFP